MRIKNKKNGLYIILLNIHGLIRSHNLELGRDADTGGQTKYVLQLARALAKNPLVGCVDIFSRWISDPEVGPDYAKSWEPISPGANIIRIKCGPPGPPTHTNKYLRKELLWPYLKTFTKNAIEHIKNNGREPDIIHSHYADGGLTGSRLARFLDVPLVYTGHSLGRVKYERLLDKGIKKSVIEARYNISQRIKAEESTLKNAVLVVASTQQEVKEQYSLYDHQPKRIIVIPPGVNFSRFYPPSRSNNATPSPIKAKVMKFLKDPNKPIILAISRPDERKNISTLVRAYAENQRLREKANLVVVAGTRKDILTMEEGPREVIKSLLLMVDRYDLYGSIAYPKQHEPKDIPDLYRLAAKSRGIFVNPALTEPFGLTLIEAAASGLPVIATKYGGPKKILEICNNGKLIDPLDAKAMGEKMLYALTHNDKWEEWKKKGLEGVQNNFSWNSHVQTYLREVQKLQTKKKSRMSKLAKSRLSDVDRLLVSDLDNTLIGDTKALQELLALLKDARECLGFAISTGRSIRSTRYILKELKIPEPDIIITSVGSEIYYKHDMGKDTDWQKRINYLWEPEALQKAMDEIPGIVMQSKEEQSQYKISYNVKLGKNSNIRKIVKNLLCKLDLHANVVYSHQSFLDLLPIRVSKGKALDHLSEKWEIPIERFLAAGDSGNDEEMLKGDTLGVVVGNHSDELDCLENEPRIYFAKGFYAKGIMEGIEHYDFLDTIRIPEEERTQL